MNTKIGVTDPIVYDEDIPTGTHRDSNPKTLVSEQIISHWGLLRSIEMAVRRDGVRVYDIVLYSIGIDKRKDGLHLKFQFNEPTEAVADHAYNIHATISFLDTL